MMREQAAKLSVESDSLRRLARYLQVLGLDRSVIRRCVNPVLARRDRAAKIPFAEYSRVYCATARQVQYLSHAPPMAAGLGSEHFEFLCHGAIGQDTLGEAIDAMVRYTRMTAQQSGFYLDTDSSGRTLRLSYVITAQRQHAVAGMGFAADAKSSSLEVFASLLNWLVQRDDTIRHVSINEPDCAQVNAEKIQRVLGVALECDAPVTALYIDSACLQAPVLQSTVSLRAFLQDPLLHLAQQMLRPQPLGETIRSLFERQRRVLSMPELTAALNQSASTLYRRLREEGGSYQQLKNEFRCTYARRLLQNRQATVGDIAELLGFRETGSFIRAFRGWTGLTPSEFRQR
ncbi:MAG: hypothetical protein CME59_12240 [Halioglobus sp.]|nr:hypothetical protein [Halioglobus sp.]|tara:strand:- start:3633 stop:4670 length:1038 start_codon:yes stop_codon:yes gene_type:complete